MVFKIPYKVRVLVGGASLAAGSAFLLLHVFMGNGYPPNDMIVLSMLMMLVPSMTVDWIHYRWVGLVDKAIPRLIRAVSDAQEVGMTLPRALEEAAKLKLGPLTREVKKLVAQMSWGLPFEEALARFAERIGTLNARRFSVLVNEASLAGGDIKAALKATAEFINEMFEIEEERYREMKAYLVIIYMGFFVFIFIIVVLMKSFFIPLTTIQVGELVPIQISPAELSRVFFHMMAIQAVFSGLVAGKMSEGRMLSGLKHSLIMLLIGYFVFRYFLPW